eukprot:scaffold57839_cov46-Attheya_sp.AAC.1
MVTKEDGLKYSIMNNSCEGGHTMILLEFGCAVFVALFVRDYGDNAQQVEDRLDTGGHELYNKSSSAHTFNLPRQNATAASSYTEKTW